MNHRHAATVLILGALAMSASPAAARAPAQTNWQVVRASGKITWELDSVPFGYLGYQSASGEVTEHWHYLGGGPQVSFPFTSLRPLGPPGSSTFNFQIRPIAGNLSGHGSGMLTDGAAGSCSSDLTSLPNLPGRNATLWMAKMGRSHLALWITAENPTDLFDAEPCASALGSTVGQFPTAQPDQRHEPTVEPTRTSVLRIDPFHHAGKRLVLHLKAKFNLVVNTTDGHAHVVGSEMTTATLILRLRS
jgi:hypothetical protein